MRIVVLLVSMAGGCMRDAPRAPDDDDPNVIHLTPEQIRTAGIVTSVVALEAVEDTIVATGKVVYDDQKVFRVFSPVSGKARKVFVQLGEHVKKNDPLITIEAPEIGLAVADVGKARSDLIAAQHDVQRTKELYEARAASQRDLENATNVYMKAKSELARAEQKAWLFQSGGVVGQTYTLRSAIDGEVFMKAVSPGMEIAGQYSGRALEIFTVGDVDDVWVLADVFELDIARVRLGAEAKVVTASRTEPFRCTIDWISGSLDKETHATKVRCKVTNENHVLKPEMFVAVRIAVETKKVPAIPRSATFRLGEQTLVFVARSGNGFERTPVIVDEGQGERWSPVQHGLELGDVIVTEGTEALSRLAEKK